MCGRFVASSPPDELANYFGTSAVDEHLDERFNVAPTSKIYAVRPQSPEATAEAVSSERELAVMRWGLVPFWAKDLKVGSRMINARSETVATKPAFRGAFKKRRCLIPIDGFYEWAKTGKSSQTGKATKQPYFISRSDDELLVLAGLWERWYPKNEDGDRIPDGEPVDSCTILTCSPNNTMAAIHDRMPVLLRPGVWNDWLDPATPGESLRELMVPAPESLLRMHPVRTDVNSVRNHGPSLIEKFDPAPTASSASSQATNGQASSSEPTLFGDAS